MGRKSKLTDDQGREIAARAESESYGSLAREFSVSKTTVSRAIERWPDGAKARLPRDVWWRWTRMQEV